jgi:putative membrane protein
MSIRTLMAAATFVAAPVITLHAQVTQRDTGVVRTWPSKPVPRPTTTQAKTEVMNDSAFIREAVTGNFIEQQLGGLANSRAANPAVKQFAQQMVTDHRKMQGEWSSLGLKNGIPIKPSLDQAQQDRQRRLEGLSGAAFDRDYMNEMVQDHQRDLELFQREATSADAPEVRQLAAAGVTTIQQHLTMAQQVAGQVGANTNVAAAGQPNRTTSVGGKVRRGDEETENLRVFVHEMADNHLMQVRLGQLAQRRARNEDVKKLGGQLADDFNKWQDRWTDLAKKKGFAFQPALGPMHRDLVDRVEKAKDSKFDRVYLSTVVDNLQSVVSDLRNESGRERWPQARKLADDELKVAQQHLAQARRQQEKVDNRASK